MRRSTPVALRTSSLSQRCFSRTTGSEVAEIAPENIDTRAVSAQQGRSSMVSGMGRRADRVSFILDVPFLLAAAPPAKPRNPSRATGVAAST